jgi:hypothetical protein
MFTLFLRLIGLFALAGAIVGLVIDGTKSIAASTLTLTPLGAAWFSLNPNSLVAAQRAVEVHAGRWVWAEPVQFVLTLPTWLVLGAIAALLLLAGRRRRFRAALA